jgi:hypothetical protein
VLPLEFHTPTTILRHHQVACTPDVHQLAVGKNGSGSEGEDEALFGLGPIGITDELTTELGLSKCSELQLWKSSDSALVEKKQPLVTGFGNTLSRRVNRLAAVDKASKTPERASVQFLCNPRVLVWIRRDLFITR